MKLKKGLGWKKHQRQPRWCSAWALWKHYRKEASPGWAALSSLNLVIKFSMHRPIQQNMLLSQNLRE